MPLRPVDRGASPAPCSPGIQSVSGDTPPCRMTGVTLQSQVHYKKIECGASPAPCSQGIQSVSGDTPPCRIPGEILQIQVHYEKIECGASAAPVSTGIPSVSPPPLFFFFFLFIALKPRIERYTKSMSLKYEPAAEPPNKFVKELFKWRVPRTLSTKHSISQTPLWVGNSVGNSNVVGNSPGMRPGILTTPPC